MTVKLSALHNVRPNPEWAKLPLFDRKGWEKVRFGEVVQNINEAEHNPFQAGLERYIGLEHLEPGSLHIRKWGNVEDGTTFTRRCRPGQVLFGKRRAYQRKVAVAEFAAVVSGDIYVLAPKNDRLLPELLPFICMTERFFQHAVGTSAGSLSPRTNWSSIASFEFDLPPLNQQRRIAEILWAVDRIEERWRAVNVAADVTREIRVSRFLRESNKKVPCRDLVKLASGKAKPKDIQEKVSPTARIPVYGGNGIIGYTATPLLNRSTVVVGRVGEYCGCVRISPGESWITDNAIYVKDHDKRLLLDFLHLMLEAADLNKKKRIAGQPLISQSTIAEELIPVPPTSEQSELIESVGRLAEAARAALAQTEKSYTMICTILDALFRG